MQHICLDKIGKEFDLGAAQGSMDQSVHSSAKVLDSSWVNFGKLMKSDERIQKWNHPNVVVVQDCLHCLLSIQWFYIVLQLLTPEHQSAKLPDVWGKGRFEGCALQFGSCTQWMNCALCAFACWVSDQRGCSCFPFLCHLCPELLLSASAASWLLHSFFFCGLCAVVLLLMLAFSHQCGAAHLEALLLRCCDSHGI